MAFLHKRDIDTLKMVERSLMNLDLLLNPIHAEAPSGVSLRYDSVYDQVAEARAEDDATLPSGLWARQPKRADLTLVIALTQDALARRSKDLWLAAWLGHAEMKSRGIDVLSPILVLLEELQVRFWDTLHPELEQGDAGARSAPLQWALEQYAVLLAELPCLTTTVSYADYKLVRLGGTGSTEELDAALAATATAFFVARLALLAEIDHRLDRLHVLCEQRYADDAPSFAKIRRTVEDVRNTVALLLRMRREQEPEDVEAPAAFDDAGAGLAAEIGESADEQNARSFLERAQVATEEKIVHDAVLPAGQPHPEQGLEGAQEAASLQAPGSPIELASCEQALEQIVVAARFLTRSAPGWWVPDEGLSFRQPASHEDSGGSEASFAGRQNGSDREVSLVDEMAMPASADVLEAATLLAADGDLEGAVTLLMKDAETSAARRKSFFRRLEAAQLCVQASRHEVARYLLERLLVEISEFGVEQWEGTQVTGQVLSLLLQCTGPEDESHNPETQQTTRMARLCAVDPVRALQLQAER